MRDEEEPALSEANGIRQFLDTEQPGFFAKFTLSGPSEILRPSAEGLRMTAEGLP